MFNNYFSSPSFISLFANVHRMSYINVIGVDVVDVESNHLDARNVVWNTGTTAWKKRTWKSSKHQFFSCKSSITNTILCCRVNVIKYNVLWATSTFVENINHLDWNHPSYRHRVPCICSCPRYWVIMQRLLALLYRRGFFVYKQRNGMIVIN